MAAMNMSEITCSPTWAQPSVEGTKVYVACNKSNEIVEVDAPSWSLERRIPAGNGVYNLGVASDAKMLIATRQETRAVEILQQGIGLVPYDVELYRLLGHTYWSLKKPTQACEVFDKANQTFPHDDAMRDLRKQCALTQNDSLAH